MAQKSTLHIIIRKVGSDPSFRLNTTIGVVTCSLHTVNCLFLHGKLRRNVTFVLKEKPKFSMQQKLTASVWQPPCPKKASLFISILAISAGKWKRSRDSFSFWNELYRSLFRLIGLFVLLFAATSASTVYSGLNAVQSLRFIHSHPHLRALICRAKRTHWNKSSKQGSADTVTTTHV